MGSADVRSTETARPPGVSARLKVGRDPVKSVNIRSEARDILDENTARACAVENVEEGRPQITLVAASASFAGMTPGLAGDASCEQVHMSNCVELSIGHLLQVSEDRDMRPVQFKLLTAALVGFAQSGDLPAGPLKAQGKSADSAAHLQRAH